MEIMNAPELRKDLHNQIDRLCKSFLNSGAFIISIAFITYKVND